MRKEDDLYEKNETLRIVGMYSFLFYLVACVVAVYAISRDKIAIWFVIIPFFVGAVLIIRFLCCGKKLIRNEQSGGTTKYKVTVVEESEQNGAKRYVCDVRHL
jgi:hypothetical protein